MRSRRPSVSELGATGSTIFANVLTPSEYNSELQWPKSLAVFDRMRRSDGQVKAALLACELPVRAARWDVSPASDSSLDQEIAEFIRTNLFESMSITWDDFLHHVLMMLPFGHSVFEKVFELDGDQYRWRKMAPRLQTSIIQWNVDDDGGLRSITQQAPPKYDWTEIPVEKLLIFTHGREGSDYVGTSLLRAAYKHWYYKDALYLIDGIAAERHGVGLAVFKLPPTATTDGADSDLAKVKQIGEALHAHERSYIALPPEYDLQLQGVNGQLHDIIRSAEHHDNQIAKSVLSQFINLGAAGTGSYALSTDQSRFFLLALQTLGTHICNVVNRFGIRQLVDYNWPGITKYPKLVVSGLEQRDMAAYVDAVNKVVTSGVVRTDEEVEAEMRRFLHFPPRKATAQPVVSRVDPEPKLAEPVVRRPRGAEVYCAFDSMEKQLDSAESQFIKAAKSIQAKQITSMAGYVTEGLRRGDYEFGFGIPYLDEMAESIEAVLLKLADQGREHVRTELNKQRQALHLAELSIGKEASTTESFLRARAKATASVLGAKLRASAVWEGLRQAGDGNVSQQALVSVLVGLSTQDLDNTAKFSVAEALNLGRQVEANAHREEISRVIYSAIMDTGTCPKCAALDIHEYRFPSAEWDRVAPPLFNCEGRDRCRCVGVYVHSDEVRGR